MQRRRRLVGDNLESLTKALVAHFAADLAEDDAAFLLRCPKLRNKLFHAELSSVRGRIGELAPDVPVDAGAWQADLRAGTARPVAGTSTRSGRVFGWFLELANGGALDETANTMRRARRLLEALAARVVARQVAEEDGERTELEAAQMRAAFEAMVTGVTGHRTK